MVLDVPYVSIPPAHQAWRFTRIEAVQTAPAHGATRARGEGPGPVPRHHRSQKGPTSESTVLDVVPFLALPRAWVVGSPLS